MTNSGALYQVISADPGWRCVLYQQFFSIYLTEKKKKKKEFCFLELANGKIL